MNERIKLLAEQAGIYKLNLSDETDYWILEKFAELIVQECMNQVNEQYIPVLEDKEMMTNPHWVGYVHCGVDSVVGIREHFGVEK